MSDETRSGSVRSGASGLPLGVFISVAFGQLLIEFFVAAFGTRVNDFYINEIGLASWVVSLAFILYAVYNMVNDPIIGFFTDRPRRFWKRYGKRFPWIAGSGVPWAASFVLLFLAPNLDPGNHTWTIFAWLLFTICLYDTMFSIYDTNYNGLIPDKFRSDRQRVRQSAFAVGLGLVGSVAGAILPPMFVTYGERSTFATSAMIVAGIGAIAFLLSLPGVWETREMRERAVRAAEAPRERFFAAMGTALRHRNFVAYLIVYLCYQSLSLLMLGSVPYVVRFILNAAPETESMIFGGYIVTGLLSIPVWTIVVRRLGYKRVFVAGGIVVALMALPLLFVSTVTGMIVVISISGVGLIGFWVMLLPILGDVIDEATVLQGKRHEGMYMGIRTFFGRVAIIVQALTFGAVQILTGFEPGSAVQSARAVFGIRIQLAIVPMVLMLAGVLLFRAIYDLTPEKKERIRARIAELEL